MLHNVVLGVSHLTASVELRDSLKFLEDELSMAHRTFLSENGVHEAAILSTCNRTEIYLAVDEAANLSHLLKIWFDCRGIDLEKHRSEIFFLEHADAVQHLFRVVCSLDSLVVGEGQILGQVKKAYTKASEMKYTGLYTHHLFQQAIALGKKVRSETQINQGAVSISLAAVELCKKVWGDLSKSRVGIVGTGEMGELATLHLQSAGVTHFDFINRNTNNAQKIATRFGAHVWSLERLPEVLPLLDVVICCTAAPHFVISKAQIEAAQKIRRKSQIYVDIAAPRDIEASADQLRSCYVFSIDDLKQVVEDNRAKRLEAVAQVEEILDSELNTFTDWYHSLEVIPVIKDIRDSIQDLIEVELNRLKLVGEARSQAEELLNSFSNKVLHKPLTSLKALSEEGLTQEAIYFAERLFLGKNPS